MSTGPMGGKSTAKVLELHDTIKDHIADLANSPNSPHVHPQMAAIPGFVVPALISAAEMFVPMLTEMALAKVGGPIEAALVSHKDAIVKFVGPMALQFASKLIGDLQGLTPAPTPTPQPAK